MNFFITKKLKEALGDNKITGLLILQKDLIKISNLS